MSDDKKELTTEDKIKHLQEQLRNLGYVGGRAIDALDLINMSSYYAKDAVKVAQATNWLSNVAQDVAAQVKGLQEQIAALQPVKPKLEVVSPEGEPPGPKVGKGALAPSAGDSK